MKILVAQDELSVRSAIVYQLKSSISTKDAEVRQTDSSGVLDELSSNGPFDLVITDTKLRRPDRAIDYYGMFGIIRSELKDTPVVLLTAANDTRTTEIVNDLPNIYRYVTIPWHRSELGEAVDELCAKYRLRDRAVRRISLSEAAGLAIATLIEIEHARDVARDIAARAESSINSN